MTPPRSVRPTWTRRVPGSAILGFFLMTAGLWISSIFAWNASQPELAVILLALGAFFPILWLTVRLRTRPIWALRIRSGKEGLVDSLREALKDYRPVAVGPTEVGDSGLFRGFETVFRIGDPDCLVGLGQHPSDALTTLLLVARSNDRKAIARLRATIEAKVLRLDGSS